MTEGLLLALAQINPVMGDISGNVAKLRAFREQAKNKNADLLVTPELSLCGYPPEDLALKSGFQKASQKAIEELAADTVTGPAMLIGTVWVEQGLLYNAMLLLDQGRIASKIFKRTLPNYGPFDEKRIFTAGPLPCMTHFRGHKLGIMICEDMWSSTAAGALKDDGASVLLVPNGSPYETDKQVEREALARQRVQETGLSLVYLNQIGGQDELVFDGASFVMDAKGMCVVRAKSWQEDLLFVQLSEDGQVEFPSRSREGLGEGWQTPALSEPAPSLSCPGLGYSPSPQAGGDSPAAISASDIYNALMLGLRDYVLKNGFSCVVLGLSGGIDSALVAALAVDAFGADKVSCVMMPSPYTSQESIDDAAAVARNLKCPCDTIPITHVMTGFEVTLKNTFAGKPADLTEENIQARCRGLILMALSNKFGPMVLSTGNKSEMAVGYSTLYGDLCGGFAVIKDLYKTDVYKVSKWRNANKPATGKGPEGVVIPERVLTKAPTAELRPNQKDQDSLPPYDILDDILFSLIEKDMSVGEISSHNEATVKRVAQMLDHAEYKRRQAPPGTKISRRNLGRDRRYPITNKYREN